MNSPFDVQLARDRHVTLLREAEVDRLLLAGRVPQPGVAARVRTSVLRWAVTAHRRLHELDDSWSKPARERGLPR